MRGFCLYDVIGKHHPSKKWIELRLSSSSTQNINLDENARVQVAIDDVLFIHNSDIRELFRMGLRI